VSRRAPELLVSATRAVAKGETFFSPSLDSSLIETALDPGARRDTQDLTAREAEILQLIAGGQSNRLIAGALDISPRTVAVHRMNLMKKLNVHNTASLLRRAEQEGLILPGAP